MKAVRTSTRLLWIVLALVMWKTVRADWIAEAPYHWWEKGSDYYERASIDLPISPIWRSPKLDDVKPNAKSWDDLFDAGGSYGITGPPVVRPCWELIGIKLIGGFIVASLIVILF